MQFSFSFYCESELDESFLWNAFFIKHTRRIWLNSVKLLASLLLYFSTSLHDSGLLFPRESSRSRSFSFCPSARVVFHIPDWLHHLLMTGRILVKSTLEAYTDHYLRHKLNQVVQEHRLVSLITLLRGTHKKKNNQKIKKKEEVSS